jgi:hypothetical protein
MGESDRGSKRRRWVWTLLFVMLGTISMVGPTQAVSNLVSATVTVMTALSRVLGPTAQAEPSALEATSALTSPRPSSIGPQITIERAVELLSGTDGPSLEGGAVSASDGTGSRASATNDQASNAASGGGRSSATGAGGGGFGGGGSGGSGTDASGEMTDAAGAPPATAGPAIADGATVDSATESEWIAAIVGGGAVGESVIGSATGGDDVTTESIVQSLLGTDQELAASEGVGDDIVAGPDPLSNSPASESLAGDADYSAPTSAGGDVASTSIGGDVLSPVGTAGGSPFAGADVTSATGLAHSLVHQSLADQRADRLSARASADAGNNAGGSGNSGVGVAQLPEPSSLILLSLGVAVFVRRTRRRR